MVNFAGQQRYHARTDRKLLASLPKSDELICYYATPAVGLGNGGFCSAYTQKGFHAANNLVRLPDTRGCHRRLAHPFSCAAACEDMTVPVGMRSFQAPSRPAWASLGASGSRKAHVSWWLQVLHGLWPDFGQIYESAGNPAPYVGFKVFSNCVEFV